VVPLDDVVLAMRDMAAASRALKETSEGGLALTPVAKRLPPGHVTRNAMMK